VLDQSDFKLFLKAILAHGDIVKIANWYGVTEQAISQKLNPNLEIPCDLYRGLRQAEAISKINPEAGAKLRALINDLFDQWDASVVPSRPEILLGEISGEFAELLKARLSNKPIHLQRKEALDLQAEVARFVESLELMEVRA
jgi:hypothetical protein